MRQDGFNVRQWLNWLDSRGSASKNYKNGVHVVLVSLQTRRRTKEVLLMIAGCARVVPNVYVVLVSLQT